MLTIADRTKPFVPETIAEILGHVVTDCVPKGFYYYVRTMSSEDTATYDEDSIQEIETVKWRFEGAGLSTPAVQYLRLGRTVIIMSTGSSFSTGRDPHDIRETPLGFSGYVV